MCVCVCVCVCMCVCVCVCVCMCVYLYVPLKGSYPLLYIDFYWPKDFRVSSGQTFPATCSVRVHARRSGDLGTNGG